MVREAHLGTHGSLLADGGRDEAAKWNAVLGKLEGVERGLASVLA